MPSAKSETTRPRPPTSTNDPAAESAITEDPSDVLGRLASPDLSEHDQLLLENEALRACVQQFAGMRSENPYVNRQIERCRAALRVIHKRRKALKTRDEVEEACFFVINAATEAKIRNPAVCIHRYGKNDWDAFIDEFEKPEFIGVGYGNNPLEAVRDLLALTKVYLARCKRGSLRGPSKSV